MNYILHHGTVTGDASAQIRAFCNMDDGYGGELNDGCLATLDAADWLNTGRMVTVYSEDLGTQIQFQQHCLRG